MSAADSAVQTAIYTRLAAVSGLTGLLASGASSIFDFVPQELADTDAEFPFLVIGELSATAFDSDDRLGHEVTANVHTWQRQARGKKSVQDIMAQVYAALHRHDLSVSGFNTVDCLWDGLSEVMRDPDGLTYHGVQRFRVTVTTGA